MPNSDANALEIKNLSFQYKGTKRKALDDINLSVKSGEFLVVMGPSGAGKSTLCLTLNGLIPNMKKGEFSGEVNVFGKKSSENKVSQLARDIVLVFQDFETQLFSTNVELEVAFGPENFGIDPDEIAQRIKDALEQVRLTGFENRQPATLSGGQKQRLAIASVLSIGPKIICMDEPTTDLDPIGKYDIFSISENLRQQQEITMIIVEHETEEALKADRVVIMKDGRIVAEGDTRQILSDSDLLEDCSIKPLDVAKVFKALGVENPPLTPEEGKEEWEKRGFSFDEQKFRRLVEEQDTARERTYGEPLIRIKGLTHRYDNGVMALKGVDLTIRKGEFVAVLGQNGSGKTTLVKHLNGLLLPTDGYVEVAGMDVSKTSIFELSKTVGYVFQNPDHQIFAQKVWDEVAFGPKLFGVSDDEINVRVQEALQAVGLTGFEEADPFSLTKGQRQRVAVASVLAAKPQVIILDEPTTGLDYREQKTMMELIKRLNEMGHTIIMVTHSMWVTAGYAHRAVVVRDGNIVMDGKVRDVFSREAELTEAFLVPPQIVRFGNLLGSTTLTVDEFLACAAKGDEQV